MVMKQTGAIAWRLTFALVALLACARCARAEDYWQQRTHYAIDADFRPDSNRIVAHMELRYWNNSSDTLREVYFHLYQNAFKPGSELDAYYRQFDYYDVADLEPSDRGWIRVDSLAVGGQAQVPDSAATSSTVWHLPLPAPLLPGDSLDFAIAYTCQIPQAGFRNGARGGHYDVAQWYPRISVYDRHGWHPYPVLDNGEFYADFGDYDVTLRAPEKFIIAHTGMLVNEAELFPDLPAGSADSILVDILKQPGKETAKDTTSDSTRSADSAAPADTLSAPADTTTHKPDSARTRTWILRAENVIDFAWAADPKFIWDRTRTKDGVLIDCVYPPSAKEHWQKNGADYTRFCIELFSEKFGPYPYPHFTSIAGNIGGGVEYPMLTFMGQRTRARPRYSLFSLVAHEVAHNWSYGIWASDEVAEPFLDEGFADFATVLAHEARYGRWDNQSERTTYMARRFADPDDERSSEQRSYISFRSRIEDEPPLATSAENFPAGGYYYTLVYSKASTVLFALMDVVGEEAFWRGIRRYWDLWHLKHPTGRDMFACFEEEAGRNLQWFWEEWYEQNWTVDLRLDDVRLVPSAEGTKLYARVKRNGRSAMPATLRVEVPGRRHADFRLAVEPWLAQKNDHTFEFAWPDSLGAKIAGAAIDPDLYLPDLDRTNNYTGLMPTETRFVPPAFVYPGRRSALRLDRRRLEHQPRIWYNEEDGMKPGWAGWTSWLGVADRWNASAWLGTESGRIDWHIDHTEFWEGLSRFWEWGASHEKHDGRWVAELFARRDLGPHSWARHELRLAWRVSETLDELPAYLHAQTPWSTGRNSVAVLDYDKTMRFRHHEQRLAGTIASSFIVSDFSYQQAQIELAGEWKLPSVPHFQSRLYLALTGGHPPLQERPGLAAAAAAEYFRDSYHRSRGTLPARAFADAHLFLPGGGDLHGYLDRFTYPDNMATANVLHEAPLPPFARVGGVPVMSETLDALQLGVFGGAGWIWSNDQRLKDARFLADMGFVLRYDIPYRLLTRLLGDRPLRIFFPIWLSDPAPGDYPLEFRWQVAFATAW
jgi:hypothetical protein